MKRSLRINFLIAAIAFVVAMAAMFLMSREPTEPLTTEVLRAARQQWQTEDLTDYRIRYDMHGSVYDVEVRRGIVETATTDGVPIRSADPGAYSIDGLFDTLELELENRSDPLGPFAGRAETMVMRVRFNKKLGYVERYLRSSGSVGRGASIVVLAFESIE